MTDYNDYDKYPEVSIVIDNGGHTIKFSEVVDDGEYVTFVTSEVYVAGDPEITELVHKIVQRAKDDAAAGGLTTCSDCTPDNGRHHIDCQTNWI